MKTIWSVLVGITVAVLIFMGMHHLITWIASGASNSDLRLVLIIVMWVVFGGFTLWISIIVGIFAGALFDAVIGEKLNRKRWTRRKK